MTDSYNSMKEKLSAVGIYNISENSNVSNELCAFAEGIDGVFSEIDKMAEEYFIETASDYGISRRERFLGKERLEYSVEKRREMLKLQESDIGGKCTPKAFNDLLKSYGLSDFSLTEEPEENKLIIYINDELSEEIKKMIRERISFEFPAHLDIEVDFLQ